ncbi:CoA pyrophosphatase [Paracandidimonas soli]|uniref:8-oxo-dGTP pyrophosphatase MutT (NUDIX family) n=1 Tax=Paracandidimonas soli TaxID=1917182 RepID=A0A4R3V8I7_9BURK|nr:CoA pyrophosphatase [Paracandidimonas soli]TCV01436.1 8-oxo-dGTP pyrophosphatase MutT (NUDIX family) [Paracandidimonas soli]
MANTPIISGTPRLRLTRPGFDPRLQPVVPLSPGTILPQDALSEDFIRRAFRQGGSWQVEPLLAELFDAHGLRQPGLVHAAVFMPLVQRLDGLHVLFTRRATHLSDHAGQISFPGGRIEASDRDPIAAAIRETQEEVGIDPVYLDFIGTQPSMLTSTGFTMTPIVGAIRPGFSMRPDPSEVAEVFEVPLSVLMDPARHSLHRAALPDGTDRLYFSMLWEEHFIWGATAALIRNFYRFLQAAAGR